MSDQHFNEQMTGSAIAEKTAAEATTPAGGVDPFGKAIPMNPPRANEVPATNPGSIEALLSPEDAERFRTRWNEIQTKFVDGPRVSVQQADDLVSEVIEQITRAFSNELRGLENQWDQNKDVSTEDLRNALQHYRSFFNRLLG